MRRGLRRRALADFRQRHRPKTGRKFFLDYPCDLKRGKVTFIPIHGAGSIANRQRHYFPAADYVQKYRPVATRPPRRTTPAAGWARRMTPTGRA